MLAIAARAIVFLSTVIYLVAPASAEPHPHYHLSSRSHFSHLAPLAKRDVLEDVACSLGVKSACIKVNVDTSSDINNCGSVGHKCPTSYYNGGGSVSCVDSLCVSTCIAGHAFSRALGQCVNLSTDVRNCGAIDNACFVADGTASCRAGSCSLAFCDSGFTEDATGWSCVQDNYQTDVQNCGRRGRRCLVGTGSLAVTCSAGECQSTKCSAGYNLVSGSCTTQSTNPSSPDTSSDPDNCGATENQCPTSYANGQGSTCVSGICQPSTCDTGYAFDASISACRQVTSDPQNCGSVGNVCTTLNGVAGCQNGECTTLSCTPPLQLFNGKCVGSPSASARARQKLKKRVSNKSVKLCPGKESACPIVGSTSFLLAQASGFKAFRSQDIEKVEAAGGYECLDTDYTLESCGGCASMGEGQNCALIPHAHSTGCNSGKCMVFSCTAGFKPTWNGAGCTRAPTPSRFRRSHSKRAWPRHSRGAGNH
ncbi:hypothetical protein BCR35DRAFT_289978 [Leucosporidium creatinivorum]|uniref:Protein CPL1-like domain-containing protein n=1 Tax=Leucosporidium creatinivorum TaxID=106004 RepID=A0A1Y2FN03_9BASI|nr:hypothetical protein BCR35DRAFT_289978 [Leucosporidium creatinivorum]